MALTMSISRIDWVKLISEESKISPILKLEDLVSRFGVSELRVRRALFRLSDRGLVERFGKKLFINLLARDFSGRELVNVLRPKSYISLETALRDSGITSQTPVSLTCVTTGAPASFTSKVVSIVFRHIAPPLYWGFQSRRTQYGVYNLAEPEKALLDWLYLQRKQGNEIVTDEFNFGKLDSDKLLSYATKYPKPVRYQLLEIMLRTDTARRDMTSQGSTQASKATFAHPSKRPVIA
jgi:predicted transcriptional regulator of viral defense system